MPVGDDVTLGEVVRNLDALAHQLQRVDEKMARGFESVDGRFNTLAMVHSDVYLADRRADSDRQKNTVERIERIEGSLQWLGRTVVGLVLAAVIAAIITAAGLPH